MDPKSCSLLRRVESMIRLCTHAKRKGRERDSRNAAWPGPTNGKEGRWRVEVGDKVMLEVSSWKDVVHFGKKEMLTPRYVGPFEIIKGIDPMAY
ncbi:hypothetical protein Tco_0210175 [Tanacetum coccineum]